MTQTPGCTGAACKYALLKGVASTCNNPKTKLRLINSGGLEVINVTIDNHRMFVESTDAVPVEPVEVGSLRINNGQRYDVLVCSKTGSLAPAFVRAYIEAVQFNQPALLSETALALLYYTPTPPTGNALPANKTTYAPPRLCTTCTGNTGLRPEKVLRVANDPDLQPPPPTRTITLEVSMFNDVNGIQYAHFNNVSTARGWHWEGRSLALRWGPAPPPRQRAGKRERGVLPSLAPPHPRCPRAPHPPTPPARCHCP